MIHFINQLFEFIVFTVIVKIIVGHWLAEQILKWGNNFFLDAERDLRAKAIWQHFQHRARGEGHAASDVTACREGDCAVFSRTAQHSQAAVFQSTSL